VVNANSSELGYPNILSPFLAFSVFILVFALFSSGADFLPFHPVYNFFFYNQSFLIIFLLASVFVISVTRVYTSSRNIAKFEYDLLFSFVFLGSTCLCFAGDFLQVYLAIELQSLCLYVFANFNRNSEFSTESGLKYFIFGAIISCFLLFGFFLLYFSFGSTSFETLFCLTSSSQNSLFFAGLLFVLIAFLFKVGAAPFHS